MFNALAGPARAASQVSLRPRIPISPFRALHASSSVLKKPSRKAVAVKEFDNDESDGDLFAVDTSTPVSTQATDDQDASAVSALNREIRESLWEIVKRGARPTDDARESRRAQLPIQRNILDSYIQACESRLDLESLRGLLRGWRVMGKRVTGTQAQQIIDKSIELNFPEIALELLNDKLAYGVNTVPDSAYFRLCHSLLEQEAPPSKLPTYLQSGRHSIALGNLVLFLRTRSRASDTSAISGDGVKKSPKTGVRLPASAPKSHEPLPHPITKDEVEFVNFALDTLHSAGGRWAEVAEQVLPRKRWDRHLVRREQVVAEKKAAAVKTA
ncbi:hypothetical protein BD324DRAFT_638166 [Kockovaella imperatae]|uniref:Uncharacterized protein n=1 Tax=Kockovaella imperatae TaxID=4999 RepID=A0A1Y1UAE3_9TREE|nr:hypothetical protein BD324DRAFT_638166 [Kockovaella imperatae]ORX34045.1 hypothetical protein BD324DRAFT_638166 [Kockovaella imperatae]